MVFIRKGNIIQLSNQISDGVITTNKLADNAVTSIKLADNAVTTNKLADNSVNSNKIIDASISNADIPNNTISAGKLVTDSLVKFATYEGFPGTSGVTILSGYSSPTGIAKVIFWGKCDIITLKVTDGSGNTIATKTGTFQTSEGDANGVNVVITLNYTSGAPTMNFIVSSTGDGIAQAYVLIFTK
jgi:hypothetical protein